MARTGSSGALKLRTRAVGRRWKPKRRRPVTVGGAGAAAVQTWVAGGETSRVPSGSVAVATRVSVPGPAAARPAGPRAAGVPARVAEAPTGGAVKVTRPPATGSPKGLATATTRGTGNGEPAGAVWRSPAAIARVKPRDSKAPMSGATPW